MRFIWSRLLRSIGGVSPVQKLRHNLPVLVGGEFYVVQFFDGLTLKHQVLTVGDFLAIRLSSISLSAKYKILALKVGNGIQPGVWWVDEYVYNAEQVNISFTSQGGGGGGDEGDPKSFAGRIAVEGLPAQRRVLAVGIDGDAPRLLAEALSDPVTGQYVLNWRGYTGQIVVTALDDYGVPHVEGEARGGGERIHPSYPTGYVYQVTAAGVLGAEPVWPAQDGAQVVSGTVRMTAVPFYRPKAAGHFTIV